MEHLNKFVIEDCFGEKITSFCIPQSKVEDFVVEADIPLFAGHTQQLVQRYFWYLMEKYLSNLRYRQLIRRTHDRGDAFFYVRYA